MGFVLIIFGHSCCCSPTANTGEKPIRQSLYNQHTQLDLVLCIFVLAGMGVFPHFFSKILIMSFGKTEEDQNISDTIADTPLDGTKDGRQSLA